MALTLRYFVDSFYPTLPWSYCREEWGTECLDSGPQEASRATSLAGSGVRTTSAEFYFTWVGSQQVDRMRYSFISPQEHHSAREGEHRWWHRISQLEPGAGTGCGLDRHRGDYVQGCEEFGQGLLLPRPLSLRGDAGAPGAGTHLAGRLRRRAVLPAAAMAQAPGTAGLVRRRHPGVLLTGHLLREHHHVRLVQPLRPQHLQVSGDIRFGVPYLSSCSSGMPISWPRWTPSPPYCPVWLSSGFWATWRTRTTPPTSLVWSMEVRAWLSYLTRTPSPSLSGCHSYSPCCSSSCSSSWASAAMWAWPPACPPWSRISSDTWRTGLWWLV